MNLSNLKVKLISKRKTRSIKRFLKAVTAQKKLLTIYMHIYINIFLCVCCCSSVYFYVYNYLNSHTQSLYIYMYFYIYIYIYIHKIFINKLNVPFRADWSNHFEFPNSQRCSPKPFSKKELDIRRGIINSHGWGNNGIDSLEFSNKSICWAEFLYIFGSDCSFPSLFDLTTQRRPHVPMPNSFSLKLLNSCSSFFRF